jgi:DNA repair protein REV1
LKLPPREARPTFTTQELSSLSELRDTLSAWFEEFREEGPHPDDVGAMERYLRRVVCEERDLGKVVGVLRWVGWLVDDTDGEDQGVKAWTEALRGMEERVQDAVRERGLGRLEM